MIDDASRARGGLLLLLLLLLLILLAVITRHKLLIHEGNHGVQQALQQGQGMVKVTVITTVAC